MEANFVCKRGYAGSPDQEDVRIEGDGVPFIHEKERHDTLNWISKRILVAGHEGMKAFLGSECMQQRQAETSI